MNSGVAQEALPQDGSHGKQRNTQVKAVVWQVMGVGQAPHAGDRFRGRDSGRGNGGIRTNLSSKKKNRDRTLSSPNGLRAHRTIQPLMERAEKSQSSQEMGVMSAAWIKEDRVSFTAPLLIC